MDQINIFKRQSEIEGRYAPEYRCINNPILVIHTYNFLSLLAIYLHNLDGVGRGADGGGGGNDVVGGGENGVGRGADRGGGEDRVGVGED